MTTRPQGSVPPNAAPDVARLGLVRPPILYLTSIAAGTLIQFARPLPFLPGTLAVPLGASIIVVAIALFSYAVGRFRAAGTPVPARKPTTVIVSTGPYRFSRNPIYLTFSLLQLGIAIWVNSLWLIATLVAAVAIIHYVVIPREEEYWNESSVQSIWITSALSAVGCSRPWPPPSPCRDNPTMHLSIFKARARANTFHPA